MLVCNDHTVRLLTGLLALAMVSIFLAYHHLKVREAEWRRRLERERYRNRAHAAERRAARMEVPTILPEDMEDVPGDPRISLRGDPAGLEQDYSR